MAKTRSISSNAMKLLDRCNQPVYILDANQRLLFANQACADWIGLELPALKNARCIFSASPLDDPLENATRGLCPPASFFRLKPDSQLTLMKEQGDRFAIFSTLPCPDGPPQLHWQQATFSPLTDDQSRLTGILVIASGIDQPSQSECSKPVTDAMANSAGLHQLLAEVESNAKNQLQIQALVGSSPLAMLVRRQAFAAVQSSGDVLITGPAGSGREQLARTIFHQRSENDSSADPSHPASLIPLHCSLADPQMIQNSIREFASRGSQANRDWLLLLNIDALDDNAQAELLGFAQLPKFFLQTLTTSRESLIELASQGKFNSELAHHLSTTTIQLPPLSQRTQDVPLLAQSILESDNLRRDIPMTGFSTAAIEMISEFDWPENIDQLKQVIQQASEKATGKKITQNDLPDWFHAAISAQRIGRSQPTEIKLDEYLQEIEGQLIRRALAWTKGNKSKASKMLGVSRPKLLRRIQLLGIEPATGKPNAAAETVDESAFEEAD